MEGWTSCRMEQWLSVMGVRSRVTLDGNVLRAHPGQTAERFSSLNEFLSQEVDKTVP